MGIGPGMMTETEITHNKLIAEQLGHTLDLVRSELAAVQAEPGTPG